LLQQARRAEQEDTLEKMDRALGSESFFRQFRETLKKPENRELSGFADTVESVSEEYERSDLAGRKKALARLEEEGARLRLDYGTAKPGPLAYLSEYSGPGPNQPIRRDAQGNGELPAENVAFLGRSLFTDYLLAVELAGTLLLVATVGAIAVATRTGERAP